ncbi:hypothetical protein, partial [Burkholderia sp. LMG 13014]|uniref:hypothetical protein n=1 Tax=Burkholderia sp. LMG 13014 TaxID=2709306 RepID=UPI001965BD10
VLRRHRWFSTTSVSNEIDRIRDKNHRTESDTQIPRSAEKHRLLQQVLGHASRKYRSTPARIVHNLLINIRNIRTLHTCSNTLPPLNGRHARQRDV